MEDTAMDTDLNNIRENELNEAIELYGHKLLRYCHNILCDYEDALDAVQETFIKAFYKRNLYKENISMQAWLYRIAYTTCIDMLRYKKIRGFFPYKAHTTYVCNDNEYMSEELKEALMTLSPKDRALVFSRAIDEKSYGELELIYDASSSALRKRYERAKKKLACILRGKHMDYKKEEEKDE